MPEPLSGGIFLSYKCTSECRHCMYACSPRWKDDWISIRDLENVLQLFATKINKKYPPGYKKIGVNYGVHFTGGEPFLNFELLLKATQIAHELEIPAVFAETNCFWCINDGVVRDKLAQLRGAGLHGMLISVNPFILEYVPFERTERAVGISREVFEGNVIVYQEYFYQQFKRLDIKSALSFEGYLQKAGLEGLGYVELIPMGRAPYKLGYLYKKYSADEFFGESCEEELTRPWHVHIDNYCNYMSGYCGGISLGDARELDSICREGVDLDECPILEALVTDVKKLYELGVKFGYQELPRGYVSRCHLCVDIRKHILQRTDEFKELRPKEFYCQL